MSPLSRTLFTNILSSIVMSKSKKVTCSSWCSRFSSNCLGYKYFYEEENSPSSFIVESSSMNRDVSWNLWTRGDPLDINCWIYLDSKKCRKRFSQYGAGSMPLKMLIFCLNTRFAMVKYHFVMRKEIPSINVCLVKYLLL